MSFCIVLGKIYERVGRAKLQCFMIIDLNNINWWCEELWQDLIHGVGARRLAVVGVPPLGCEPLIRTIRDDETKCDDDLNKVAFSFNLKLKRELQTLKRLFGIKASFIDIYSIIQEAVQNPHKFGKELIIHFGQRFTRKFLTFWNKRNFQLV